MSLSQKIASNTLISYAGRIVSTVFALVAIGFITRSLGTDGFGEYTTVFAILSLFVILADLGLHSLMTREISRPATRSLGAVPFRSSSERCALPKPLAKEGRRRALLVVSHQGSLVRQRFYRVF